MTSTDLSGLLSGVGEGGPFLTLHQSAAGLGRLRYVEVGFFERVGRRASLLEPAPVAIWAEAASLAAAWRASLIAELLPVSVGLPDAAELTRSAGEAVDAALDRLGPPPAEGAADQGAGQPGSAVAGLDGAALVEHVAESFYPALLAAYETRRAARAPAADGPVLRMLVRVIADLRAELESATATAQAACRPS